MRMRAMVLFLFFAAGAVELLAAAVDHPAEKDTPCLACHKPSTTEIDPVRFAHSVHGALDCTTCHMEGFGKFPHTSKAAAMPDCSDCHTGTATPPIDFDKITEEVKASVHVKTVDAAFRCTSCHSPHYFVPARRMTDASNAVLVFNESCLGCHAAGATAAASQVAFVTLAQKHRFFPNWELHLVRTSCVACHTPRGVQTMHLILPKSQALRDCAACHGKDSLLVTKLYTHLTLKERTEHGFVNAVMFNGGYLTGANRNKWLDWIATALAGLTLLGVAAHALGRWAFARSRRKS